MGNVGRKYHASGDLSDVIQDLRGSSRTRHACLTPPYLDRLTLFLTRYPFRIRQCAACYYLLRLDALSDLSNPNLGTRII